MARVNFSLFKTHPLIVFVDDERDYLENVSRLLEHKWNFHFKLFDDPEQAYAYFKSLRKNTFFNSLSASVSATTENLSLLSGRFFSGVERFDCPVVLIVDEEMPKLKGKELCNKIKEELGLPVKIIMLTGYQDEKFGVEVLNRGNVSSFVTKLGDVTNLSLRLADTIHKLTEQYFMDCSLAPLAALTAEKNSPLKNQNFIEFFQNFINENFIEEFCLLDSLGSAVCIDKKGDISILGVVSQERLNDLAINLENDDENEVLATSLLEKLSLRQNLPFFIINDESPFPILKNWEQYFHAVSLIAGVDGLYYAHIKDVSAYKNMLPENVVTYSKYLDRLDG